MQRPTAHVTRAKAVSHANRDLKRLLLPFRAVSAQPPELKPEMTISYR